MILPCPATRPSISTSIRLIAPPLLLLIPALAITPMTHAKIVTEAVPYSHGDVQLEGFIAYDDALSGRRPGVLIVHEWWGCNDFAKERARRLAELGYVAMALDMYGKGVITSDPAKAGELAGQFKNDAKLWTERARAGFDQLARHSRVDPQRIAAIGFCFGGSTVLRLAYSGTPLAGAVSFHGGLFPPEPDATGKIKARILILHGAADTLVPDAQVAATQDGLRASGADWQIISYGGAKHSFTNPASTGLKMDGVGYDERTDKRSWQHMRAFFDEILGSAVR
ncbi:MAG: hypothetical protein CHACPFDD_03903 [Phycisphaerae bacterium]|nr:hypothetical protein [Phycisphaerae bacterium]